MVLNPDSSDNSPSVNLVDLLPEFSLFIQSMSGGNKINAKEEVKHVTKIRRYVFYNLLEKRINTRIL